MQIKELDQSIIDNFRQGTVIPAMPLALNENREFSPWHQRALTRYYIDAGAGGIAVGVHSTQFEIRDPKVGLFELVLDAVSGYIDEWCKKRNCNILKVAGVCGKTAQAIAEAEFAVNRGYHAVLLSLAAFKHATDMAMLEHCRTIAKIIPVIGFYLQPSVGGRILSYSFWREFAEIDNILGIKLAPFNRYQTFDVVRSVAESGKVITFYTGNDDNIVNDLLTEYNIRTTSGEKRIRIKGGLLGHWCVWTKKAVELLNKIQGIIASGDAIPMEMLTLNVEITDSNAVVFDAANKFAGCIPGIHEVLRRNKLLLGTWCLNPAEVLSPGQSEELDRIYSSYPHLNDDAFIAENLKVWFE